MGFKHVKSLLPAKSHYISGSEAVTEGAFAAGCNFFGGYPITPATDIAEFFAARSSDLERVFIQMEDELGSICSVIGASWAGAKAMTATSGPGFSLMQEAIGYGALTETPLVIALIQRPGPSTGQGTTFSNADIMQCKWGSHGDYHNIAICPWSVQEMYDMTIRAFNLAEQYRVPVILLSDAALSRLEERIEIGKEVEVYDRAEATEITPDTLPEKGIQPMPRFGRGLQVRVSGLTRGYYYGGIEDTLVSQTLVTRIHDKILDNKDKIIEYDSYYMDDAKIAVIAYGFTARSALYAINQLRENGTKNVGMLRLKTIWPFPDKLIAEVGAQGKTIFMPEMNMGQLAGESRKYTCGDVISYSQCNGDIIHPKTIMEELRRLL